MKKILSVALAASLLGVSTTPLVASAHPGRTDKYGGHTCRTNCEKWGLQYGEYHYHNGGSTNDLPVGDPFDENYSIPDSSSSETVHHYYNVFQNSTFIQAVDGYDNAISYAKQWSHAIVQDANTYDILWDNIHTQVFQYGKYVNDFASRKGAIAYASNREYSSVIDTDTKAVLWHNYPYSVYQGDHYLDWFHQKSDAINYAEQWAHSKVVDGLTYQIVWKNF